MRESEKMGAFARMLRRWNKRHALLQEVNAERERQRELYPDQEPGEPGELSDDGMFVVLAEEFGSVAKALHEGDIERLRDELMQVAACCVKFREKLDRERIGDPVGARPATVREFPENTTTILDTLPESVADSLREHSYTTDNAIRSAHPDDLMRVPGVGPKAMFLITRAMRDETNQLDPRLPQPYSERYPGRKVEFRGSERRSYGGSDPD